MTVAKHWNRLPTGKDLEALQKLLPVNTSFKPTAQCSLFKTRPVPWRPDKASFHQETNHSPLYKEIRISYKKGYFFFYAFYSC